MAGAAVASALTRPGYAAESNTIKVALDRLRRTRWRRGGSGVVHPGGHPVVGGGGCVSRPCPEHRGAAQTAVPKAGRCPRRSAVFRVRRLPQGDRFAGTRGCRDPGHAAGISAHAPRVCGGQRLPCVHGKVVCGGCPRHPARARGGQSAEAKGLKIAGGLMSRHYPPLEQAVAQIHQGLIGDVITAWAYRMHGPVGLSPRQPGMKELAFQIANYSCFTWLNGSFIVDWLIHNIDVCCWVKDAWPDLGAGHGRPTDPH
jgi:hypothetical protein